MPAYEDQVEHKFGNVTVNEDARLVVSGSTTSVVSFFGANGNTKAAVATIAGSEGPQLLIGLNNLIAALKTYGLV